MSQDGFIDLLKPRKPQSGASFHSYEDLIRQRNHLCKPMFFGVVAARNQLHDVNLKISRLEMDSRIFDLSFTYCRAGYTQSMLQRLFVQANHGSSVSVVEVQKHANWIIEQMRLCQC